MNNLFYKFFRKQYTESSKTTKEIVEGIVFLIVCYSKETFFFGEQAKDAETTNVETAVWGTYMFRE